MIASEESSRPLSTSLGQWGSHSGLAQCAMAATPEAARALRHFARAVAHRWRLEMDFHEALSVIVTELVSNVVLHSGSPWVAVAIKVRGNTLTTEVRDGGRWKHRPVRRQEPLDAHADCGHGLRLVDAFATSLSTRRLEVGSVVAAEIIMPVHFGSDFGSRARPPEPRRVF
ncbi:ATP-binding protein [Streptomyces sp. NBC_01142]|uniref:ATP-binding protein n=1 Tax=Streptomyces sp. NBC_01142 TaxID=2975865 RepID=UPI00225251A5|nr:ATP-binding protein [Streptomyces sp. NBC_01142]MCX4825326.1 ATP-binding protein [Streptomyces sp. NBC_01142]